MNTWLNLQQFLTTVKSEHDFGSLDDMSQKVLEWVMQHYDAKSPLFVQGVVLESRGASPRQSINALLRLIERAFCSLLLMRKMPVVES